MTVWATKTTRLRGVDPLLLCPPMPWPAPSSAAHAAEARHWDRGRLHCKEPLPKAGAEHGLRATCRRVPVCASSRAAASSIAGLGKRWRQACARRRRRRPVWAAPPCQVGEDVVCVHVVTCVGLYRPHLDWVTGPGPRRRGSGGPKRCRVTVKRVTSPGRGPAGPRLRPGPSRPSSRTHTPKSRNRVGQGCR